MRRNIKYLAFVALLLIGMSAVKIYSGLSAQKPTEAPEAAEATAPGELMLDLNEKQVASIKIGQVDTASFVLERQAVGNIDSNQNFLTQVFTPYQGRIINAYSDIGDKVEKDQVLFTIDSPNLNAAESTLIAAAGVLKLQNRTLNSRREDESLRRRLATSGRPVDNRPDERRRRVEIRARRGSHLRQDGRGDR